MRLYHTDGCIVAVNVHAGGFRAAAADVSAGIRETAAWAAVSGLVPISVSKFAVIKLPPPKLKQAHASPKAARPEAGVNVCRRQVKQGSIHSFDLLEEGAVQGGAGRVGA